LSRGVWNEGVACSAAGVPDPVNCVENDVEAMNGGNAVTTVTWEAYDFCCDDAGCGGTCPATGGEYINIDPDPGATYVTTYYLDDDQTHGGTETGFTEDYFRDTTGHGVYSNPATTWPAGSVQVCSDFTCDAGTNPNAHFDVFYHLWIDVGQADGLYDNNIQISWT
jgi:hypothetical protein